MPQPKSKLGDHSLPDPELNPLLNPLLGAHMGRWAEVYFTSPPEKRSEAVAELLRELGGSAPGVAASDVSENRNSGEGKKSEQEDANSRPEKESRTEIESHKRIAPYAAQSRPSRICGTCGYENSGEQNYCGMCGLALQWAPPAALPLEATSRAISETGPSQEEPSVPGDFLENSANSSAAHNYHRSHQEFAPTQAEAADRKWAGREVDVPHFALETESFPYRYRLFIGAALAILLAGLLYMAWRGKTSISGDAQSVPARNMPEVPSSAPSAPTPAAAANPTVKSASAPAPTNVVSESGGGSAAASATGKETRQPIESRRELKEARPAARVVHPASSHTMIAADQSGEAELATAEEYLNGTRGNSSEAVAWLWKAVAKGNLTATMTLSDMYLRGQSVSKSCDQARLLLDAAARKGNAMAAGRLRNMRAFGCQ